MRNIYGNGFGRDKNFFRAFVLVFIALTFTAIIAYWCFIGWAASKLIGGVQNGDITTEKAGEQVGKFLKGIEKGKQ
jgi:hypothetical protein